MFKPCGFNSHVMIYLYHIALFFFIIILNVLIVEEERN